MIIRTRMICVVNSTLIIASVAIAVFWPEWLKSVLGVVFLSRTDSALVVPVRHAHLYLTESAFSMLLAIR